MGAAHHAAWCRGGGTAHIGATSLARSRAGIDAIASQTVDLFADAHHRPRRERWYRPTDDDWHLLSVHHHNVGSRAVLHDALDTVNHPARASNELAGAGHDDPASTVTSTGRWSRSPSDHWMALGLLLTFLAVVLTLTGFTSHEVGRSATATAAAPVGGLDGVGPILDLSGSDVRSVAPPDHLVALTFDDGPDPRWTPAILDVLARRHVPATFFVVGANVLDHPDLVRRERDEGHDIGSHTFTHADLANVPGWRESLELSLTETALEGAIGRSTSILRLPYSSSTADLTERQLRSGQQAAGDGYLLVTATNDGEDWKRPGVPAIVRSAMPRDGRGAVVLLHDGGGDRGQTVAALDQLIDRLQAAGYEFGTVSQIAGLPQGSVNPPVERVARWQGTAFLWTFRFAHVVVDVLTVLLVVFSVLAILRALLVVVFARRHRRRPLRASGAPPPSVSVVVPAFNEEVGIATTIRSLLQSDHPVVEVIVVDDGSTDRTADIVEAFAADGVRLIRQANAGKPAALNVGVAAAAHDVVVLLDGDTVFEPATISELVAPFADPTVGAVSGNAKVANRKGLLGRWQHIEYVQGFNLDRRMYDVLECMPTVPGAVGAFRRSALEDVGGISGDTLAEDTDVTMALVRRGWRVVYTETAIAWTEAPASLRALWHQRYRWSYGTMQAMWKHRHAVRERSRMGRVSLPYLFLFQVLLPLFAPVVDLLALYGLLFLDPRRVLLAWIAFAAVQFFTAAYAFRLEREGLRPLWTLPLQQVVYRQLMYLVVIQSVVTALSGVHLGWHKLHRVGISRPA